MNKKKFSIVTAFITAVVMLASPAMCFADDGAGVEKDETVYVVTDSAGDAEDVIVSDHLVNQKGIEKISDRTNLTDIENVKGDEGFSRKGNSIIWDAGGNDIYYQGKTDSKVPVNMNVTYKLDGKQINGTRLQGKSGNVEIKISYSNSAVYGGNCVPFVAMTGFLVTDSCLTDIKIDNGKVIDDGEKQIVIGMAAPGVSQTLGLQANQQGLGDSVTITAKADNFAVEDMMTIVTNSMFEDIDTGVFAGLDYDDRIKELDRGSKSLVEGTRLLYGGISTMDSSKESLTEGVEKLNTGASALYTNLDKIKELVYANASYLNYVNGMLNDRLPALASRSNEVCESLEEISSSAGKVQVEPVNRIEDVTDTATIKEDIEKLKALKEKASEEDKAVYDSIISDMEKTAENESSIISTVNAQIDKANSQLQDNAAVLDGQNEKLEEALGEAYMVYDDARKVQIANSVINVPGTLGPDKPSWNYISDTLYGSFFGDGSTPTVITGAKGLAEGMDALNNSTGQLADGISRLDSGALDVSKGMQKLYSQGIKKIVNLYNNELKGMADGLSGMVDAGKGYNSFTKISPGVKGSVKFIYKTKISE